MKRTLVGLMLGMMLSVGAHAEAGETPKELEARWTELDGAVGRSQQAGKLTEAGEAARQALAIARRLHPKDDHITVVRSLHHLASVHRHQARYADAETASREALAMTRRLYGAQDHALLAASLDDLAAVLRLEGKATEAEKLQLESLAMYRRLYPRQDHAVLARGLNNLALVLKDQFKYPQAEALFREAWAMGRRLYPVQDHPDLATTLASLANLLHAQGRSADAEKLQREALAMRRRLYARQDHPDLAASLTNLAGQLQDRGEYAQAEAMYGETLAMLRRLYPRNDHPDLAGSLLRLAELRYAQQQYAQAEGPFREALAMHRAMARAYAATRSEGETLTLAAIHPAARDAFLSSARAARAAAASIYAELWSDKAALSRVHEQRGLAVRAAATDARVAALLARLTAERHRRADLILAVAPADQAVATERDTALARCAEQIEALGRELRPLLPAAPRADKLAAAGPADLQRALPEGAAVVDYLRWALHEYDLQRPGRAGVKWSHRYLAFVLTRDKVAWLDLGDAVPIEQAINAWRAAITAGKDIDAELPGKVRALVWAKVRAELPAHIKQLYVCPDLALCRVPWAALPGDRPGTVLLEEYAIATIPHAPFLLDRLWPRDAPPKRPTDVLTVGGVAYGDVPGQQSGWPALPGAAAEAQGVRAAAGKKDLVCRTLEKEAASCAAVLAALPQARHAHLATHGFFADAFFRKAFRIDPRLFAISIRGERIGAGATNPMVLTGLVFAGANQPQTPGRGLLTGEALVDLDLSGLELAVLSACETGLGDVAGGEGTFSLQRAFHLAGTRDVITSLWKVPDRPTAAIMGLFYRNLWDKQIPPAEALRQAQLEVYRHPERIAVLAANFRGNFAVVPGVAETAVPPAPDGKAHPRLWAAFTLSGPGR
jgi:CHAT domain-containing protein